MPFVNKCLLLALLALLVCPTKAVCFGGSPNTELDANEDCDSGAHCTEFCTCETGYEPATPLSASCVEVCLNPISPSSTSVESSLVLTLVSSLVTFGASVKHQTNSTSGSYVTETSITFGSGSVCDYPTNNLIGLQTLDTTACKDNYAFSNLAFSSFSSCLVLTCLDSNNVEVPGCNPELCNSPPCKKRWANPVKIARSYLVFNENGISFPVTSASYHPIEFQFPWIQSNSFNSAVWATPNIGGSAVITSIIYNPLSASWSVVVSSSLNWPYRLVKPVSTDVINGQVYTVSGCSDTPSSSTPCVQTISFAVPGCTGLQSIFGGNAASFTGLKYECADQTSVDCPLSSGNTPDATITVTLNSDAPCGPVTNEVFISQSDIIFQMKQSDYSSNRSSFIEGDVLNFSLEISRSIPTAAISSLYVMSFRETAFHNGISMATSKVTSPSGPCSSPSTLCFTFDTNQLTAIPDETAVDLTFVVIVQIEYSGIFKKRAALEMSNFQLSYDATLLQDTSNSGSSNTFISLIFVLISYLLL